MTSRWFWPGVVVGWSLIAVGVVGVLGDTSDVPPLRFGGWLIGLALAHDLVVVPVVLAAGLVVRRRPVLGAHLAVAAVVVLFAWPYVAGWGRSRDNETIQPRDYGRGLLLCLSVVAISAAVVAIRQRRQHRSHVADGS